MNDYLHSKELNKRDRKSDVRVQWRLIRYHIEALRQRYITPEIARAAGLYSVDSPEGARIVGQHANDTRHFDGIVIPYIRPGATSPRAFRLRRDHPEIENGKPKAKYLSEPGASNLLFFPPGQTAELINNPKVTPLFIEGELKALAVQRCLDEFGLSGEFAVIGLQGVWNWKGIIGKTTDANGARVDVKGIIDDIRSLALHGRKVIYIADSNYPTNEKVRAGVKEFLSVLRHEFGADVYLCITPDLPGVNGADDLAFRQGAQAVIDLIESAARPRYRSPRTTETAEQRCARVAALRLEQAQSLAADKIGAKQTRALARLFAQVELKDETRVLLFVFEAMAEARDEFEFSYAELFPCSTTPMTPSKCHQQAGAC